MAGNSGAFLQWIEQTVGLELSAVTLIGVWLFCFAVAKRLLSVKRRGDRGLADLARYAGTWRGRLGALYDDGVRLLLVFVDRLAGDGFLERADAAQAGGRRQPLPWSNGLYDLTLKLSLAYPLLFALAVWFWTGTASPGLELFFGTDVEGWRRGLVVIGLVVAVFFFVRYLRASGWRRWLYLAIAFVVVVVVAVAVAGAGAFAFVVAFAVAFAGAVAGAGAVAFAFAAAFTGAGAGAVAAAAAAAAAGAGVVAVAGLVAVAGVVAVAGAVAILHQRMQKSGAESAFHVVHALAFVSLALAGLYFFTVEQDPGRPQMTLLLVFLALLPLANAPLDWLSLGLTRGLLRYGMARGGGWRIALISLVDSAAAVALMFPLAAVTAAVVAAANWLAMLGGGAPVVPLGPLFDLLEKTPGDPALYWLYLMLFSTLLPSLIHILGGLVGLVLACLWGVLDAPRLAQAFVVAAPGTEVVKDSKLTTWYPALAATGATAAVAVGFMIVAAIPYAVAAASFIATALLATAQAVAGFFPA